jgi:kynurenine formamidase
MTEGTADARPLSLAEFDELFDSLKNWGRWGPEDQLGTLNLITPASVRAAAALVRSGRHVSMAVPINKVAGPDNANPAIHFVSQAHDIDIGSSGLRFGLDFLGMVCHGDNHTHVDALCHVSYRGRVYNGNLATEVLTSRGATSLDVAEYHDGLVGRGVLLDIARLRGVKWLEPGEIVTRDELEACERSVGVRVEEGDILVFRTGHHRRRAELGPWGIDYPPAGQGRAGLHVDAVRWMHERGVAAFLPDCDGEVVPSTVPGMLYPIHVLQIAAMGMLASDLTQVEDVARACDEEGRWRFMVVGLPLRLPGGTGSPWNPIAIF